MQERIGPDEVRSTCALSGLHLTEVQFALLQNYVALLLQANQSLNLVSRADNQNLWEKHILHSLAILFKLDLSGIVSLLDLGTGGGLPGIPLAIVNPGLAFTLVDSIKKKSQAVAGFVDALELNNTTVVCSRAELLSKDPAHAGAYDVVVSRAVAPLAQLIRWSNGFLRSQTLQNESHIGGPGKVPICPGTLIALKGGDLGDEMARARKKQKDIRIEVIPLDFGGIQGTTLTDKKIVIVKPK